MGQDVEIGGTSREATGGKCSKDNIHLLSLMALGGFQELEEKGPRIWRESLGFSLRRGNVLHITPTQGKTFRGSEPPQPKEELG